MPAAEEPEVPPKDTGQSATQSAAQSQPPATQTLSPPRPETTGDSGRPIIGKPAKVAATPAARRFARKHGLNLAELQSWIGQPLKRKKLEAALAEQSSATPGTFQQGSGDGQRASSLARQLAQKRGLALHSLDGSGSGGRVLRQDVVEQGSALFSLLEGSGGLCSSGFGTKQYRTGGFARTSAGYQKG